MNKAMESRIPERLLVLLKEEYPENNLEWRESSERFSLDGTDYDNKRDWAVAVLDKICQKFPFDHEFPVKRSKDWLQNYKSLILEFTGLYRTPEFSEKWFNDFKKDKKRFFLDSVVFRVKNICPYCYNEWANSGDADFCCKSKMVQDIPNN